MKSYKIWPFFSLLIFSSTLVRYYMYFVFHFLKYLCIMFIVEEDLFSYNKCTFSHSGSIDSDFDCVHFTFQGFFSLVCGSPGKTINSWIHWQQNFTNTQSWNVRVFICTITTNLLKKRWHTDLEKCSLLLVCSLIISLAMGLLPKPSLSILLVEAGIEAGIVNVHVHWLIIWSFPENKCSSFNLTYCTKIVWVQWWPKIIKWSPGVKYWLPEKQDTVQI